MFTIEGESPDAEKKEPDKVVEAEAEPTAKSEADSSPADQEEVEKKPDSSDKFQGRIDKLTRRFRESERETASVRAENERLQKELSERPEITEPAKTLADFDFDEDKYRDYIFTGATQAAEKAAERVARKLQDESRSKRVDHEFERRESEFAATVDDFQVVVYNDDLNISGVMAEEIRVSEIGPEMAYYLGKNPEDASEIAGLSQREAVRRMTQLETRLMNEKAKKPKEVSDAPPPPPQIKSGDAGMSKSIDDPDLSDAEFAKMRRKQIADR